MAKLLNGVVSNIYPVVSKTPIRPNDPLHVGNFYKDKQRHHKKSNDDRQALILYLASLHKEACRGNVPIAFRTFQISLTYLRKWVYDYRVAFDYFFEVVQTGFNISEDNKELSTVIPRWLNKSDNEDIKSRELVYVPPPLPSTGEVSKVFIQFENADYIRTRLRNENRFDLIAATEWLLSNPTSEINFWFERSGKLQLRDTSVWPIKGIETWPGWLRVALFGEGIDIESAYTQYLLGVVEESFNNPTRFKMLFPELIASYHDKVNWRINLAKRMGLEPNEAGIKVVKKICMALANGSTVSGLLLSGGTSHSSIKDTILEVRPDITLTELYDIGNHLEKISREYLSARRIACLMETKRYPTRQNQKSVFRTYFQWERDARYKIWEAVGRMGIMVHDGIDGIPLHLHDEAIKAVMSMGIKAT